MKEGGQGAGKKVGRAGWMGRNGWGRGMVSRKAGRGMRRRTSRGIRSRRVG